MSPSFDLDQLLEAARRAGVPLNITINAGPVTNHIDARTTIASGYNVAVECGNGAGGRMPRQRAPELEPAMTEKIMALPSTVRDSYPSEMLPAVVRERERRDKVYKDLEIIARHREEQQAEDSAAYERRLRDVLNLSQYE